MYYCVGNVSDFQELKEKYLIFRAKQEHLMQRKEFLVKQAEDLKDAVDKDAKEFWTMVEQEIKAMPKAPKNYADNWAVHINPETGDIITFEHKDKGLPPFIAEMMRD